MASLELRNRRALSAGQWHWDNMEPAAPAPDFLDTDEGQEWLRESAKSLISGLTVEGITHEKLIQAADECLVPEIDWDKNGPLLMVLLGEILKSDLHPLFRIANQLLGGDYDRKRQPLLELAEELLKPKAKDYCHRMEEDFD